MKRLFALFVLSVLIAVGYGTTQALAASLNAPRISPDSGTYGDSIQVSMRCSDNQAVIYYTTDGSTPTEASRRYWHPFTVDNDMTIKAIAVKGSTVSEVSSVTYIFRSVVHVENIAAYEQVPDGTLVEFDNTVTGLARSSDYLYVRDGSGCAVFYGQTGNYYFRGDVIPAGFQGVKITSGGEPMLTELRNFSKSQGFTYLNPEQITAEEVGPDMFAHLVSLDSVTYQLDEVYYAYGDGYLGTMGVSPPENQEASYNITAVIGSTTALGDVSYHLLPVTFERIPPSDPPIVITPSQVGPETVGKNVVLRHVDFDYGIITDLNGETCEYLLTYSPVFPAILSWSYDIYGIVDTYQPGWPYWIDEEEETHYHVFVTSIDMNCEHEDTTDLKGIKGLYNLANLLWTQYFDLMGRVVTPLTAVYQNGSYLYVKDIYGDYGMVYGDVYGRFKNGDIIEGAIAKAINMGGEWWLQPSQTPSFTYSGYAGRVRPDKITVADVDPDMIHRYVVFDSVSVVQQEDSFFTMTDSTGEMMLHNRFNVTFPPIAPSHWYDSDGEINIADLNLLIGAILENSENPDMWNGKYCVQGFLSLGPTGQLILLPTVFYRGYSYDVNGDNEVNIADINYLIDIIVNNH